MLLYVLYFLIAALVIGPLGEIPFSFPYIHVYLIDIPVFLLFLYWMIHASEAAVIINKHKFTHYFLLFSIICLFSLVLSPLHLQIEQKLVSFLYIFRLIGYFCIFLTVKKITRNNTTTVDYILKFLVGSIVVLSLVGWTQYFLYPDLANLSYLGWDPHYKRIFATFFDPNFLGLLLVFGFLITLFLRISRLQKGVVAGLLFITILFTYSRSTFLSLAAGSGLYCFSRRKLHLWGLIFTMCLLLIFLLPRPAGEGVKLERIFTLEARLNNWSEAISLIQKYPVLGVGFNTLRFIREEEDPAKVDSHSAGGLDNSFLFVGATTGIMGLLLYIYFILILFGSSSILVKSLLFTSIIHSFFLNSLFFPWIMVVLWIVIGSDTRIEKPLKIKVNR